MGMDVIGRKPKCDKGEYFRNNVWWWRPLWQFCCTVDPSLEDRVPYGHSNDGDGLKTQEECTELANKLRHSIQTGFANFYIEQRNLELADLPLEKCPRCENKQEAKETCMTCKGVGKIESIYRWYKLDLENIETFIAFLENCGGFQIC